MAGIAVGEVAADVSGGDRTQERIGDRMEDRIRIGMPQKTPIVRYLHPSQDQASAIHQRVNVVPLADPKSRHGRRS